jgi:hypothetical protein
MKKREDCYWVPRRQLPGLFGPILRRRKYQSAAVKCTREITATQLAQTRRQDRAGRQRE